MPSSVSVRPFLPRSISVTPNSSSSSFICALNGGWEMPSFFAAAVIVPFSTMVTKYCSCLIFIS